MLHGYIRLHVGASTRISLLSKYTKHHPYGWCFVLPGVHGSLLEELNPMLKHYWQFVRNQEKLTEELQRMTREEQGEIPVQLKTPAERRKAAQEVKALNRSIERSITRRSRERERMSKVVARGQY